MNFADRESRRALDAGSVVANIAGVKTKTGRPKVNREKRKQISVTILPSLYENAQKVAALQNISLSEVISKYLGNYVEENKDKLED